MHLAFTIANMVAKHCFAAKSHFLKQGDCSTLVRCHPGHEFFCTIFDGCRKAMLKQNSSKALATHFFRNQYAKFRDMRGPAWAGPRSIDRT